MVAQAKVTREKGRAGGGEGKAQTESNPCIGRQANVCTKVGFKWVGMVVVGKKASRQVSKDHTIMAHRRVGR